MIDVRTIPDRIAGVEAALDGLAVFTQAEAGPLTLDQAAAVLDQLQATAFDIEPGDLSPTESLEELLNDYLATLQSLREVLNPISPLELALDALTRAVDVAVGNPDAAIALLKASQMYLDNPHLARAKDPAPSETVISGFGGKPRRTIADTVRGHVPVAPEPVIHPDGVAGDR